MQNINWQRIVNLQVDDQHGLDKIHVYFKEPGELRFVPYAASVDLEPGSLDVIKHHQLVQCLNLIIL